MLLAVSSVHLSGWIAVGLPSSLGTLKKPFLSPLMMPRTTWPFALTAARSTLNVRLLASSLSHPLSKGPTMATLSVRSGVSRMYPPAEQLRTLDALFPQLAILSWSIRGRHADVAHGRHRQLLVGHAVLLIDLP